MVAGPSYDDRVPAHVATLVSRIRAEMPTHRGFLETALGTLSSEELARLDDYLAFGLSEGRPLDYLADCYLTVVEDTLREQRYFLRHKRYRHASFADVAGDVYHDDAYMSRYMHGLVLTSFFWPNHVAMARYFDEKLPSDRRGSYLEVGPGHGYFLLTAMRRGSFDDHLGIDVSETSIAQTRAIVSHFAPELRQSLRLVKSDFLACEELTEGCYDAIVMGEVLEHVERPEAFLARIRELARDDAFLYVTTCLNAPAVDHITLWRAPEELEGLIRGCGLSIVDSLYLPYEGRTLAESVEQALATNVAYVLEKA